MRRPLLGRIFPLFFPTLWGLTAGENLAVRLALLSLLAAIVLVWVGIRRVEATYTEARGADRKADHLLAKAKALEDRARTRD